MRSVAFLRNVNQGQRGHPSTADVRDAFADAGDARATTFRSNGTVLFESDDPDVFMEDVAGALFARTGVPRECFWLPLVAVERIVADHAGAPDAARRELTVHAGGRIDASDPDVAREAAHRRCIIVDAGEGWTVSVNERDRESNGTPTLERITGAPATSRGIATLAGVVER